MTPLSPLLVRRADDPPPPPELRSPGGGEIRLLREGPVTVWYAVGAPLPASLETIAAHDAVMRAALRTATPLPGRYGVSFPDEEALRASLRERQAELVEALERVRDRVEMGLRVGWEVDPMPAAEARAVRTGREYLAARREELERGEEARRRATALLDRVEAEVVPEGCPSRRKLLPDNGVAGVLAHLVHRQDVRTYRTRVDAARETLGVALHLTGPWAPYSFV